MVTFLLSALVILVIIGIGLYLWQKPRRVYAEAVLPPPPPNARGLFADTTTAESQPPELASADAAQLFERARQGDRSALTEANALPDREFYERVLTELVRQTDSDATLLALMSHVRRHELPVNDSLARAVIDSWKAAPDRNTTAKALHFAALSDNADTYRTAVELAMNLWREGKLSAITTDELKALFEGEFWVISSGSRSSGAGFNLKQTLADARRELEATTRAPR